jgi:NTP pyrophosphatase (non-canonical NTP hydrolase)
MAGAVLLDVTKLEQALAEFSREREWDQFHTPKNLVMALTGEVGELNEIFQWMTDSVAREAGRSPATAEHVGEELADVLLYLVRLSKVLGVNLNDAVVDKLAKNALKYPIDKARGSSQKAGKL